MYGEFFNQLVLRAVRVIPLEFGVPVVVSDVFPLFSECALFEVYGYADNLEDFDMSLDGDTRTYHRIGEFVFYDVLGARCFSHYMASDYDRIGTFRHPGIIGLSDEGVGNLFGLQNRLPLNWRYKDGIGDTDSNGDVFPTMSMQWRVDNQNTPGITGITTKIYPHSNYPPEVDYTLPDIESLAIQYDLGTGRIDSFNAKFNFNPRQPWLGDTANLKASPVPNYVSDNSYKASVYADNSWQSVLLQFPSLSYVGFRRINFRASGCGLVIRGYTYRTSDPLL